MTLRFHKLIMFLIMPFIFLIQVSITSTSEDLLSFFVWNIHLFMVSLFSIARPVERLYEDMLNLSFGHLSALLYVISNISFYLEVMVLQSKVFA